MEPFDKKIFCAGQLMNFETAPVVIDKVVLVPVRPVADKMGVTLTWHDSDKSLTATKGKDSLTMKIGSSDATLNGKAIKLKTAPILVQERTLAPAEDFVKAMGGRYSVGFLDKNITIG